MLTRTLPVALRKESVDRNSLCDLLQCLFTGVALRKESVDRNIYWDFQTPGIMRRSPQGERG